LCDTNLSSTGGTWNQSGQILVGSNLTAPLFTVSTAGSRCQNANQLDLSRGERGHAFPQFLPDGRHYIYFAVSAKREFTGIVAGSLDSKETKFLLASQAPAVYASGHLLFMREQTLVARRFNPDKLEFEGEEEPVAENIATSPYGDAMFSASANGVLVYRSGSAGTTQLTWVDRSGKSLGTVGPPGEYVNPELSTDGKQVAFQRRNAQGDRDVWQMNLERATPQRFTFGAADEALPVWSPDGSRLVFASSQDGASSLFQKNANGGGNEELLLRNDRAIPVNWSLDGKSLFFRIASDVGINEIWFLQPEGDRKGVPYIQSKQFNRNQPRLSPSGRWLAYYANDSGFSELYLESFPKFGGKWQVSSGGGVSHRWSRDGKEIYYMAPNGDLMAATVKGEAAPELGTPTALFRMRILGGPRTLQGYRSQYDVAPDGRFLVNTPVDESAGASMTVVLNWAAGLK
jgi:Tol biopolymer transport system component